MPFFYRHSEGAIIEKPANVVNAGGGPREYFTGPFVREWWFENDLLRPLRTGREIHRARAAIAAIQSLTRSDELLREALVEARSMLETCAGQLRDLSYRDMANDALMVLHKIDAALSRTGEAGK